MRRTFIFLVLVGLLAGGYSVAAAESGCFQCHDRKKFQGAAVHSPVARGECGKCHNPHVAKYEGLLREKGAGLCYSCHGQKEEEFGRGIVHQPVKKGECSACHAAHASGQAGLLNKPLAALCSSCHEQAVQQYKVAHKPYAQGKCTVCHQPHQSSHEQLLKSGVAQLCLPCHKEPDALAGHQGFPTRVEDCLSCHTPHGSSRKGLLREYVHPPFEQGCATCHGKNIADSGLCLSCHAGVREQMLTPHNHLLSMTGNTCILCHSPHAGDNRKLLKRKESQLCLSCHGDTGERMRASLHHHSKIEQCSECHDAHGANRFALLKADGNAVCSRCHETQGVFSHPVGEKVIDQRTGKAMDCLTCHDPMGTDFKYHLKQSGTKDLCVQCHRSY
ncbi:cytochrome c3 family protein [Thiovibrio sp. JS02]